jgi:transcriptional regulator with XRE-family HTH domain/Zn-dependent peptidase ImmA (M78 family)
MVMIKNERQYRITKAQIAKFSDALDRLSGSPPNDLSVHPLLRKAERDALESQFTELRAQVREYEALKEGQQAILELDSLEALPNALIKARIAAGLTQKDLAEQLGMKEQQIQRYEETEYASASFTRLVEVSRAIGVQVREEVLLPKVSLADLLSQLSQSGIDRDLMLKRFFPSANEGETSTANGLVLRTATALKRVFGWSLSDLFGSSQLQLDLAPLGAVRFKVSTKANQQRLNTYTVYAHFLALLVLKASADLPAQPIPPNPKQVREAICSIYGELTFSNALRYVWSLGIPVLPLKDTGAFHGAFWRVNGRNVIVLKQRTQSSDRWLLDLFHELYHATQEPELLERSVVEEEDIAQARQEPSEEKTATKYSQHILLDGRHEELVEMCVIESKGSIERFKNVLPEVAARENVSVGALANYMAYRLSLQGENWWGAATNLQMEDTDPWQIARDIFLEKINFGLLNEVDRKLLSKALLDLSALLPQQDL